METIINGKIIQIFDQIKIEFALTGLFEFRQVK